MNFSKKAVMLQEAVCHTSLCCSWHDIISQSTIEILGSTSKVILRTTVFLLLIVKASECSTVN